MGLIILACIIKYPSLRFGGDYAAATGQTLIESYRKQGRWAIVIYALFEVGGAAFVIAAITLFLTGLVHSALVPQLPGVAVSAGLLSIITALLISGKYRLLESMTTVMVVLFTILILVATSLATPRLFQSPLVFLPPMIDGTLVLYLLPLIGFMPTTPTASVMQSLWTVAKYEGLAARDSRGVRLDFDIGYITTCFLALCFIVLGAALLHNNGIVIEKSNIGFAEQLLQVFTDVLGAWTFPIVAGAAFLVIFSTLITVVDGLTRVSVALWHMVKSPAYEQTEVQRYRVTMIILCSAAFTVIVGFAKSFTVLIDFLGLITFLIGPFIAWLNHRAMFDSKTALSYYPGGFLRVWSLLSIAALLGLGLTYLIFRLK
ncbi:hypothetical protein [Haliea sp.]